MSSRGPDWLSGASSHIWCVAYERCLFLIFVFLFSPSCDPFLFGASATAATMSGRGRDVVKINTTIGLLSAATLAAGLGFATGFAAQNTPQFAYFVAESVVTNPEEDAKIIARLPATAEALGGRYIVRGGKIAAYDGEPPKRIVIVAFDSLETIHAWREMPAVKELETARKAIGTSLRTFAVEGVTR
jgi:uncharacterized protein (DUF1330 family)